MESLFVRERHTDASKENSFFNKGLWKFRKVMTVALIAAALLVVSLPLHAMTYIHQLQTPAGYVTDTRIPPYHVNQYTVQYLVPRPPSVTSIPAPVPGAPRPAPGPLVALETLSPGAGEWRDYQICSTPEQVDNAQAALRGYTTRVVNSGTSVYHWMYPAGGDYTSGRWVAHHIRYNSPR